jgi:hypothetical protein
MYLVQQATTKLNIVSFVTTNCGESTDCLTTQKFAYEMLHGHGASDDVNVRMAAFEDNTNLQTFVCDNSASDAKNTDTKLRILQVPATGTQSGTLKTYSMSSWY